MLSKKLVDFGNVEKVRARHRFNVPKDAPRGRIGDFLGPVDAEGGVDRRRDVLGVNGAFLLPPAFDDFGALVVGGTDGAAAPNPAPANKPLMAKR